MTEPDRVTYEVLVSDGSYSHVRLGLSTDVEEGETTQQAFARARSLVRLNAREEFKKLGGLRGWADDEAASPSDGP
jgi:hypothetical protein